MPDQGETVTVSLADLETMMWATAALQQIEGIMAARKSDPFVKPHLNFGPAHKHIADAVRDVKRGNAATLVPWNGELTASEIEDLRGYYRCGPDCIYSSPANQGLLAKGCIEVGSYAEGVVWAGHRDVDWTSNPLRQKIRLTVRGVKKLMEVGFGEEQNDATQSASGKPARSDREGGAGFNALLHRMRRIWSFWVRG